MYNSCKQRAEYLHHSLVIVHTECGQWQASSTRKLAGLTEVSVAEQILQNSKFPEILGELSMRKHSVPGSFFSTHAQEPGNKAISI